MALALRSWGVRSGNSIISFLIVATGNLSEKISEVLLRNSRKRKCHAVVHQCESIVDVVRLKPELSVDFIVFAFDWRVKSSISEVEANISLIDKDYIISGCVCLVNYTGVPKPLNLTFAQAKKISKKFNLSLITKNILDANDILALGDALLNLAEVRLGTKIGIPMLPKPLEVNS